MVFVASTAHDSAVQRVVAPLPGSSGDPTLGGATLQVYNAAGLTSDAVTVALPASGWKALIGGASAPRGWRFRGDASSAIRSIVVKDDRIVVRGGKSNWAYSLDEPAQGQVALRLQLGSDAGWCAETAASPKGSPPSTAKTDRPGLFKANAGSSAPAVCPAMP